MSTALDIIKNALSLLQIADPTQTLSARESSDGMTFLNMLLDSWSTENLLIYDNVNESFNLTPSKNPHTWGPGGDLNSSRPTKLLSVRTSGTAGVQYPCEIVTYQNYQAILIKSISSPFPRYAYLENSYPLAKLYLYPVPSAIGPLVTWAEKPFTTFTDLTDVVTMPPGWARALTYNLAVDMASMYQVNAGPEIMSIAVQSKNNLKRMGNKPVTMTVDPAVLAKNRRRYNIFIGE